MAAAARPPPSYTMRITCPDGKGGASCHVSRYEVATCRPISATPNRRHVHSPRLPSPPRTGRRLIQLGSRVPVTSPRLPQPLPLAATSAKSTALQSDQVRSPATVAAVKEGTDFVWIRHWWPLIPEPYLKPDRPNPITLMGIPMVVWRDARGTWRVFRDRCPHRLAPLSEGRVEADGSLVCSYHGWRFDGSGACHRIPQAVDAAAETAACSSRRSCATTYPSRMEVGILWVWPDDAPGAATAAAGTPVVIGRNLRLQVEEHSEHMRKAAPQVAISWFMRDMPYSYEILIENLTDPSHLPFSHHGTTPLLHRDKGGAMPMKPSKAMTARTLGAVPGGGDVAAGPPLHWARADGPDFEYDFVGDISPDSTISVHMPFHVTNTYRMGQVQQVVMLAVPVAPDRSRFFHMVQRGPPPSPLKLLLRLLSGPQQVARGILAMCDPLVSQHILMNEVVEGDSVFLSVQDELVREAELKANAAAAEGVALVATAAGARADLRANGGASEAANGGSRSIPAAGGGASFWSRLYYMPTPADSVVLAVRRWLDERAGGGPFRSRQRHLLQGSLATMTRALPAGPISLPASVPGEPPDPARRVRRLDRYQQHTRSCPFCSRRLEQLQQLVATARAVQQACLLSMCIAGGALGATMTAAVTSPWYTPAAALGALLTLWAVAGALAAAAGSLCQNFLFKDYVHAERN